MGPTEVPRTRAAELWRSAGNAMAQHTVIQVLDFVPRSRRSMELFLLALAARLRDKNWRTVHVFSGEPSDEFRARLSDLDSPYFLGTFPLSPTRGKDLGRQLRSFKPTVIQTHFLSKFEPGLRVLKRSAGARRLVVTDHTSGLASKKSLPGRLLSRLRGWWAGSYIDQIIAVSEFVRHRDINDFHYPSGKIRVVYNGVDTNRFSPTAAPPNEVFTIAFAGQLIPQKGVLTLLQAVQILVAGGSAVRVRVAGRGPQAGELECFCAAASLQNQVEFLGHIDCVEHLFHTSDVVVVPSEGGEAFGFVAAEAAACGACVVVSSDGALPEVVGSDGEAGLIFAKGDAVDLAHKLVDLMGNPSRRKRLGRAARARVEACFSLEKMVEGYCNYFDEVKGLMGN